MKIEKGTPGYLNARKIRLLLLTLLEFGIVIALLVLGYMQTGTRLNLLTVVAIVGCLPACKMLVGLITVLPYRTADQEKATEIQDKAPLLTTAFDLVITSREKIMPVEAVVISGNTVCGYAPNKKTVPEEAARHIKNILEENRLTKITVKIFSDYTPFLTRAEGLNSIAQVEQSEHRKRENRIRRILLNISM